MKRIFFYLVSLVIACLFTVVPAIAEVPADGSAEEAYQRFTCAIVSGSFGEALRYMSLAQCDALQKKTEQERDAAFQSIRNQVPEAQKIINKETVGETKVIFFAEGMVPDLRLKRMRKSYGRTVLVKEYGRWKIDELFWQSRPFK